MLKPITAGIVLLLTGTLFLNGCGKQEPKALPSTPQEAVEYTMESLKTLDLKTFNACTDNYVQTWHNWIGVPAEREYRIFNELLQPRAKHRKRYQSDYRLAQKMTENLEWEIADIRENGDTAEIDMEVTNINMRKAMENYETRILENVLESEGLGIMQLMTDLSELVAGKETLLAIIDDLEDSDICTVSVTAQAYQDNGQWKIHLSRDFINAFSGNMYSDDYAEATEQQISGLENQIESNAETWAENLEKKITKKITGWEGQFE